MADYLNYQKTMKHLYRKQEENSTVTTPSPISTTQIYRHPNSANRFNNFESAAITSMIRFKHFYQLSSTFQSQHLFDAN